jgi:hypothetical protein
MKKQGEELFSGPMEQTGIFENQELRMEVKDNILYANYKAGLRITLEDAKRFVLQRLEFLKGEEYPIIVLDEGIVSMDKAAREYVVSMEGVQGITSAAFIENTFHSKMLVDFILRISNPRIQLMAFANIDDAIEWVTGINLPLHK